LQPAAFDLPAQLAVMPARTLAQSCDDSVQRELRLLEQACEAAMCGCHKEWLMQKEQRAYVEAWSHMEHLLDCEHKLTDTRCMLLEQFYMCL